MAYGTSRRRRERDPDIRDLVEDAAREAGLSVPEFIDAALAEQEAAARVRRAPQRPLRLVSDSERPLDALERRLAAGDADDAAEDRIARALGKAFDEIKASEQRTARLIEQIATLSPAANATPPRSVADILASAERRARRSADAIEASDRGAPRPAALPDLVDRLQRSMSRHEVETALGLIERKLAMIRPQSVADRVVLDGMSAEIAGLRSVVTAEGAEVPLAAIEGPLASLTARLDRLAAAPQPPSPAAEPIRIDALERRLDEVTAATTAMVAGIQDELVRLGRNGLKRDAAAVDAGFDRLENRIQQLENASEGPLNQIRQDLLALQASIGRESSDPALRAAISGIEKKLDQIAARIAQPLQMVHNAVTQLSRQRGAAGVDPQKLDQLFSELAALKRGIAAHSTLPDVRVLARTVASLSDRIDGIAHRMQQDAQHDGERDPGRKAIDEELEEIKELLREAKSPCDDTRVLDAIGQLERKIAALENSPRAVMERLDRLQARLDERPASGANPGLPSNIDLLLRNISARLEAASLAAPAAAGVDESAIAELHQEIRSLGRKLEQIHVPGRPGASPDLSQVERSIGDILRQIDGLRVDVGDRAARAAADAVREFGLPASLVAPLPPPVDTGHIEAAISELRQQQTDAELRTNRTLEALHDTLHRVVDRLGSMERDNRAPTPPPAAMPVQPEPAVVAATRPVQAQAPAPMPPPATLPEPPRHPAFIAQDVSNLLPQDILAPAPPAPAAPAPKAESFAETLANLRAQQGAKADPVEQRSAMASAFAAAREAMANLRGGQQRNDGKPHSAPAAGPSPAPAPEPQSAPDLDLPLEPGASRPTVTAGRGVEPPAAPKVMTAGPSDPKAEFLAAARRAAQAAAQQAAAPAAEGRKGIGRLWRSAPQPAPEAAPAPASVAAAAAEPKGSGFRAKHAALLGAAALVVAVGAGWQFLGTPRKAAAPIDPPPRTSSIIPPAAQEPVQTASTAPRQQPATAPRQILPPALNAEPPRAETPPARTAPGDEQVNVGSIAPPDRVPSAATPPIDRNDPLFRFEGLKDAPKLREAALRGDPNAFLELGQRYADGRGATRDFKTAALWLERAAENGSAPARYRLGSMFREGKGVERNARTALRHFQAAAEAGNVRAMHNTAVLLAEGVNGAPDYATAAEWFRKAAEHGVKDSQYNLAILHARGLGVTQDLAASYAWFAAAANQGDEDAAKKRDEVGSRMTPERLQQARAAALAWKPKSPDPAANEGVAPAGGWDSEARAAPAAPTSRPQPRRL